MLKYELRSFRMACMIGMVHTTLLLVIDYWRVEHYAYDVLYRGVMLSVLTGVILVSRLDNVNVKGHAILCLFTSTSILLLSIFMDMSAGMPSFFLPNFLCLLFYVFNAGLGHPLRLKYIHTTLAFLGFVLYGRYLSPHEGPHLSQAFNVFINATVSLLIGYLIEQYKRTNYAQRIKIEGLNDIKTKLIAVFSHDINGPLSNLLALLNLRSAGTLAEHELNHYTDKVKNSIESVLDMVKDLVRWSKLQLEGAKPALVEVDIKKVTGDVIKSVAGMADVKGVQVRYQTEMTEPIQMDSEVYKLVVRNFLTNAIKFSFRDSLVTVSTMVQAGLFTVSVRDTGTGISEENTQKLFAFNSFSGTGTQAEKGWGIGLAIAREFASLVNGKISVQSEVGKGSTFSATFPLGEPGV